jgi:alkylation response protein AidB-like acyl-CoA dehydrogenase
MTDTLPDPKAFVAAASAWLADNADLRKESGAWGEGSDDVSVFLAHAHDEEAAVIAAAMEWQQRKFDAGYGALSWPTSFGGAGLPTRYDRLFTEQEERFATPMAHETFSVTLHLVAPTIREYGTEEQKARFIPRFLRTEELCCQLFSEPGAGSDLAGLGTRAVRDGDEWVITGQKVWSSGAAFAEWGECICRTDLDAPKHKGLTAFMVPMDAPGVEIRPIKQMTGGASFNEVFLDGVRVPDANRLGDPGAGWRVTLATLNFERANAGSGAGHHGVGGSFDQVLELARSMGRAADAVTRQRLASLFVHLRVREMNEARLMAAVDGEPDAAGSIGKLLWTQWMTEAADVVSGLLGPRLAADTGEWGTYAWTQHLLGAPGYRIAGGSDEIQRNIIGERVLGLPPEPKVDRR